LQQKHRLGNQDLGIASSLHCSGGCEKYGPHTEPWLSPVLPRTAVVVIVELPELLILKGASAAYRHKLGSVYLRFKPWFWQLITCLMTSMKFWMHPLALQRSNLTVYFACFLVKISPKSSGFVVMANSHFGQAVALGGLGLTWRHNLLAACT
jgi:hypothetical protein